MSKSDWTRVTKQHPCPVCGRDHWCLIGDTDVACTKAPSPRPTGWEMPSWFHPLASATPTRGAFVPPRKSKQARRPIAINWTALVDIYVRSVTPARLAELAVTLGLTVASLQALDTGWDGEVWCYPERRPDGAIIGIKRRTSPEKVYVAGSHPGLYIPRDLNGSDPLFVCEGWSDCAAIHGLGVSVIGRPNCDGGSEYVAEFVRGRIVVIISDNDPVNRWGRRPGQEGAKVLSDKLQGIAASVRTIVPPTKDARAWVRTGLTREELLKWIA